VKSLKNQNYRGEFEIIVVDNASADNTSEVARNSGARVIREERKGVSQARRRGCAEAKGEIFALSDADSKLPPDWLTRLNNIFNSDKNIVAAGGLFRFDEVGFAVDWLANKFFLPLNSFVLKYFVTPFSPFLTGSNMAVRREAYTKSGGFDPELVYAEDNELAKRLVACGKVYFDSKLIVRTSFRRYSGGHKNIFLVLPKAIKETFVTISRFISFKSGKENFSAQTAVRENKKINALTFDDGPYGKATEKILDILKEKNIKATFFILGSNAKKYPEILKRELEEGHIIGNHSFSHSRLLFLRSPRKIFEEIEKTNSEINRAISLRSRFYRAPYGHRTPWMYKKMISRGFRFIPVGILAGDWNAKKKPEDITKKILKKIKPGSIITLHDGRDTQINYSRENIIKALPAIIDGIRSSGFEIVPLDRLIGEKAYF
jgi:peptidoglycan/xylan/chitin deacetylase (PgdA/CDA1 family)